ncbi:septum site-determining protein Ssd [Stackebrandtia nassauensis]|uniref:Uncharacterized protein n=1 Tax=Stackebrandtia nassauensis (strain DSM 44728 / CIP 108903 / NRRL B-16338 / NBRC 102104 / LLR-40K-21) TaxID=446470 RepID=D3PZ71_STANL|nr:septum site-determining protein Ssd [Stackebrandtia nassauensis]ADD45500.1 hypothetical protein Snas_5871 [Stackebrandtia nassauensis DSM 44728]
MDNTADARPLFITGDELTRAALRKLATAAGTEAHHAPTPDAARRHWNRATVVVIAADLAQACADARLPHRGEIILLTGPELPYDQAWPLALAMGATQVASLPEAGAWLARQLAPATTRPHRAPVATITGARGGVGASTLAAGLAIAAADSGRTTLLIDADPRGGGLDVLLGWENRDGLRWPDLTGMPGPYDPDRLRPSLPHDSHLGLLSFSRNRSVHLDPATVTAVLDAATRSHDLVVIDAPRYGEPWLPDLISGSTLLGLVVPAEVRAIAAARQAIAVHAPQTDRARLILATTTPARLSTTDIVNAVGVPVATEIRRDPRLAAAAETGALPTRARHGTLVTAAKALLTELPDPQPDEPATPQLAGAPS